MLDKEKLREACNYEYGFLTAVYRDSWMFFGERDSTFRGRLFVFSNNQYDECEGFSIMAAMTGTLQHNLGYVGDLGKFIPPIEDILTKAHKIYDWIIAWILGDNENKLPAGVKIKRYKLESKMELPLFLKKNVTTQVVAG